jgi:anthranilate synthase component 2
MILIIDNYDSFTYNLVQLVAIANVPYQVHRNDALTIEDISALNPDKILISPGPGRPEDAGISCDIIRHFGAKTPILGVCLGHQAIGHVFGAKVDYAPTLMHGKTSEVVHRRTSLFQGVSNPFIATRYHSLVLAPGTIDPKQLQITSETKDGVIMGIKHTLFSVEGIQFHPESVLTVEGPKIIQNWINS